MELNINNRSYVLIYLSRYLVQKTEGNFSVLESSCHL